MSPVRLTPPTLRVGNRTLVVLAGLPGAGKSTLLAKLRPIESVSVLDSEQVRETLRRFLPSWVPYRSYRPLVHLVHRARIVLECLSSAKPVLAHEPSTRATTRAMFVLLRILTRRRLVLLWIETDPSDALAGQRARRRMIARRSFARHVRRAVRFYDRLRSGEVPRGWNTVHIFKREQLAAGLRVELE